MRPCLTRDKRASIPHTIELGLRIVLDDLNELRTFVRILARGSLSAAARDLGISLAVASKRLASLERRAGARLIQRTTRSLAPTEEGQGLLVHAERILDTLASAEEHLATGRQEPVGVLRVGAPVSFGRRHVAPVLGRLVVRHPRLDVDLTLDDEVSSLVAERLDVAVRIGAPRDSALAMRKLAENRRILVAAPRYLDRHGRPDTPEGVGRLQALRYGAGREPWRLIGPDGRAAEILLPTRLRSDNGDVVHEWAQDGLGVMLKSQIDVSADIASGRLERVLPDFASAPAPIHALFPAGRAPPTKLRIFLDALLEHLDAASPR